MLLCLLPVFFFFFSIYLCWNLDHCCSLSRFSASPLPVLWLPSPRISCAHGLLTPPFSAPSLTSSLWCLAECRAGRPWSDLGGYNEFLIMSQETRCWTPHPVTLPLNTSNTHKQSEEEKKKWLHSFPTPGPHREIVLERQGRGSDKKSHRTYCLYPWQTTTRPPE